MDLLIAKAMEMTEAQIVECVKLLGGDHLPTDKNMVRAALIQAYQNKTSPEQADALMDEIGM